jgi:hypothetical protein
VAKEKSKEAARPTAARSGKAEKKVTVEIKESSFPILANLKRGGGKDAKALQAEMQRVLVAASEVAQKGSDKEKKEAEQIQKAYALSLAVLENSKIVR